jgi:hypothetical protein
MAPGQYRVYAKRLSDALPGTGLPLPHNLTLYFLIILAKAT